MTSKTWKVESDKVIFSFLFNNMYIKRKWHMLTFRTTDTSSLLFWKGEIDSIRTISLIIKIFGISYYYFKNHYKNFSLFYCDYSYTNLWKTGRKLIMAFNISLFYSEVGFFYNFFMNYHLEIRIQMHILFYNKNIIQ